MITLTLHVIVPHMMLYFSDLKCLILKRFKRNKREDSDIGPFIFFD